MEKESKPLKVLSIRLKPETHQQLKDARWEYRMSMQEIIEEAIEEFFINKKGKRCIHESAN